ncbi:DEP domain-containing protein 7 [Syngnathus scovelli]|uniref:DEP domain-containing protein 7 n=1 Tax=Syngnathus scovelli TaxID=161590 RepID=UPI00210F3F76|nr:DEP domain-containing protein 7 [Syngnathus scovelli]XP_049575059.1 DEP domain-containing protein 7 [Syngnathus scovelli]
MAEKPFRATQIWSSIISNLHTHVEVKRRRHNLKSYHDCFLGSEAVDAVLAHITLNHFFGDEAVPRQKAIRLCQALMDSKVFEPVGHKVFGKEKKRDTFEDSSYSLYRFPSTETDLSPLNNTKSNSIESGYDSPGKSRNKNSYRQDVPIYFTHSPVRKGKSVDEILQNLNLNSTITPQINLGVSRELAVKVWHQQTVCRLLQLIELPLLENKHDYRNSLHAGESHSNLTSGYMDREVLKAFSEAQEDEWMSGAIDCLDFLPDAQVVKVSKGLVGCTNNLECKKLLYEVLARHYARDEQPPLFSNHVFDIHSGISELLVNGKLGQALEALQLSLKLQDSGGREELRRLLRFMAIAANTEDIKLHQEIENRMAVKRSFSSAIVHSRRLSKGKVDLMVLFMMDNHHDLFKVPASLHTMVSDRLKNIDRGEDADIITGSTSSTRQTAKAYPENGEKHTEDESWSLLRTIHENPNLPSKEKRRLLAQFYKDHPDIFVQYSSNKLSSMNKLLQ